MFSFAAEPSSAASKDEVFKPRPNVDLWLNISEVVFPILLLCAIWVLTMNTMAMYEKGRSKLDKLRVALLVMDVSILAYMLQGLVLIFHRVDPPSDTSENGIETRLCLKSAGPLIASFYVVAQGATYIIFLERANAVKRALGASERLKRAKSVAKYATYLSLPFLVVLPWFLLSSQVLAENVCAMKGDSLPSALMAAFDSTLSLLFLYCFAVPLLAHSRSMDNVDHHVSRKTKYIARRNLLFSSVTIVSTFVTMVLLTIFNSLYNSDKDERYKYLQITSHFIAAVDLFIKSWCIHSMTVVWMPMFLRKKMLRRSPLYSSEDARKKVTSMSSRLYRMSKKFSKSSKEEYGDETEGSRETRESKLSKGPNTEGSIMKQQPDSEQQDVEAMDPEVEHNPDTNGSSKNTTAKEWRNGEEIVPLGVGHEYDEYLDEGTTTQQTQTRPVTDAQSGETTSLGWGEDRV